MEKEQKKRGGRKKKKKWEKKRKQLQIIKYIADYSRAKKEDPVAMSSRKTQDKGQLREARWLEHVGDPVGLEEKRKKKKRWKPYFVIKGRQPSRKATKGWSRTGKEAINEREKERATPVGWGRSREESEGW